MKPRRIVPKSTKPIDSTKAGLIDLILNNERKFLPISVLPKLMSPFSAKIGSRGIDVFSNDRSRNI